LVKVSPNGFGLGEGGLADTFNQGTMFIAAFANTVLGAVASTKLDTKQKKK